MAAVTRIFNIPLLATGGGGGASGCGFPGVGVVERDAGSELVAALEWADREERKVDSFSSGLSARPLVEHQRDAAGHMEMVGTERRAVLVESRRLCNRVLPNTSRLRREGDMRMRSSRASTSLYILPAYTVHTHATAVVFTPDRAVLS